MEPASTISLQLTLNVTGGLKRRILAMHCVLYTDFEPSKQKQLNESSIYLIHIQIVKNIFEIKTIASKLSFDDREIDFDIDS